jgi:hypothetical protein
MSWFDEGGNGLSVAHQVGIWNPAGTLIAATNVTIPSGTAATLDGNYRTVAIPATVLPVGNGYIVGGYNGSGSTDCLSFNVTQTPHPNITYIDATFSGINGIFERPTSFSAANNGFYGVGFQTDGGCTPCLSADGLEDNDICTQAVLLGNGQINNLTCQKFDWDYYRAVVNPGGTLQVDILFVDNLGDMDLFLYTSLANCQTNENVQSHGCGGTVSCGFSTSDNETASYFNNTGSPVTVWIEVNLWGPTPFDCNDYSLVISGARENAIACDPAASHSGGTYAKLNTSSTSGPGIFHLECTDGPPSNFGYFLVSGTLVDPGNPVSNGFLCLGAPIGRYAPAAGGALNSVGQFNAAGRLQNLAGTSSNGFGYDVMTTLPSPPGGVILPGSTWYFQCWYRDGNRSNFSNVFCKTF